MSKDNFQKKFFVRRNYCKDDDPLSKNQQSIFNYYEY